MIALHLLGTVFGVEAPPPVADELARLFASSACDSPAEARVSVSATGGRFACSSDDGATAAADTVDEAVAVAAALLNQSAVARCPSFAVHAGVVAGRGRVIAFPATSGLGKSTLTAALLRAGWGYVSDEALAMDDDLVVQPYHRPLALHAWSLGRLGLAAAPAGLDERLVLPSELGAAEAGPGMLTDVLLLQRGERPEVEPAPPSAVATSLLQHAFNHYRHPARAVRLTGTAASECSGWRVTVGDPVQTALRLSDVLA